jgi:alkanesulfonate monooxygenase SsuD/methylene tetrahydromethanopterin reductase-like flavin-dependent oxidoreductase (luciferase family)
MTSAWLLLSMRGQIPARAPRPACAFPWPLSTGAARSAARAPGVAGVADVAGRDHGHEGIDWGETAVVEFGAHLPLMDFGGNPYTLSHLATYTRTAAGLGFTALSVNDHMVFAVPWLDGPTALAAVLEHSGDMALGTTVSLPVVRGPVPLAKSLAAIDRLSGGRLFVAVGPGSSEDDYASVGIDFEERWARLDESIGVLRSFWSRDAPPFTGRFYSSEGIALRPLPAQPHGPPIWVGSWGSDAGLRRVARHADGWLASAYNTTPDDFAEAWARLQALLADRGTDPATFPNALATMWFHITDDAAEAERVMRERIVPTIHRPEEILRERVPVGPAEVLAKKLAAFARAGVQRVFLWPVADEVPQLERFWADVRPLVLASLDRSP